MARKQPVWQGNTSGGSGGGSTLLDRAPPSLPAGVTLQAIDGETMTSPLAMSKNYWARNGYSIATNPAYNGISYDDTTYYPLWIDYGVYVDNITNGWMALYTCTTTYLVTGNTPTASLQAAGIRAVVSMASVGTPELALGNWAVGLHVDESDPLSFMASMTAAQTIGAGRFWEVAFASTHFTNDDIGTKHMKQILAANYGVTSDSVPVSIAACCSDIFWFSLTNNPGGTGLSNTSFVGAIVGNGTATADQVARGSHYGNMIDVIRARVNGASGINFTGTPGVNGSYTVGATNGVTDVACRIPIHSIPENGDGNPSFPAGVSGAGANINCTTELPWAVWSAIIHGARGINYFCYSYPQGGGTDISGFCNPGGAPPTSAASIATVANHGRINALARVINSPFALGYLTAVSPHGYRFPTYEPNWLNGGIEGMAKWYQGGTYTPSSGPLSGVPITNGFYIFATTRFSETITGTVATFTINHGNQPTKINVLGEGRTITSFTPLGGGVYSFQDTFANAWTVHIYQIS